MNLIQKEHSAFALTYAQRSIWMQQKINPQSNAYNIPILFRVYNENLNTIEKVLRSALIKYDILRSVLIEKDGLPFLIHLPLNKQFKIEIFEENSTPHKDCLKKIVQECFDIFTGPLYRFAIVLNNKGEVSILIVVHHIIMDGTSMFLLAKEIRECLQEGRNDKLVFEKQAIDYHRNVTDESQYLASELSLKHRDYWLNKLTSYTNELTLPYDYLYNSSNRRSSSRKVIADNALHKKLESVAKVQNSSIYNLLFSCYIILIHRLSGQSDITIGSPVINRNKANSKDLGFFLNTVMLRNEIFPEMKASDLIKSTKSTLIGALRHKIYPFSNIVSDLKYTPSPDSFPVSNIFFNGLTFFDDYIVEEAFDAFQNNFGLDIIFDLNCYVSFSSHKLLIRFDYRKSLFKEETVDVLLSKYLKIIEAVCNDPEQKICDLQYADLPVTTKAFTDAPWYNKNYTVVDVFEQQVTNYPNNVAVKCLDNSLTYSQLNALAAKLSNTLTGKNKQVGIYVTHNSNLAIAVLGVLKAGKIYIPIDVKYPALRIKEIITDTALETIIVDDSTESVLRSILGNVNCVNINYSLNTTTSIVNKTINITPDTEAYIMFTSGSSGKARGLIQKHKSLLHYISNYTTALDINSEDTLTGFSSCSYDSFNNDFFGAVLNGATYCPLSLRDNPESEFLAHWVKNNAITIWHSIPTLFKLYCDKWVHAQTTFSCLRIVKMTGEPVRADHFALFKTITSPKCKFTVSLGSTESTLICINTFDHKYVSSKSILPVGFPINRTDVFISRSGVERLGVFEIGEIIVESNFISSYFSEIDLPEIFFEDEIGKKYYRTGDIGRWMPDGRLEWISRKNGYIKVNGIRVEPGEIEYYFLKHPLLRDVVVKYTDVNNSPELVCFYIAEEKILPDSLNDFISTYLPTTCIPGRYVHLTEFPKTDSGKTDKRSLQFKVDDSDHQYVISNEIERKLHDIWSKILNGNISTTVNFFTCGGNSIKAIQMVQDIKGTFNLDISLKQIFECNTIVNLAKYIDKARRENNFYEEIPSLPWNSYYPLSSSQRRLWLLSQFEDQNVSYNITGTYLVEGRLEKNSLEYSLKKIVQRHEILRTTFKENEYGEISQFIYTLSENAFKLEYNDLRLDKHQENSVRKLISADILKPFNLSADILIRAALYQLNENKWIFTYAMHHIISDGWSMSVFIKELFAYYNAHVNGEIFTPTPLRIQYRDYANWQNNQLVNQDSINKHRNYWLNQFKEEHGALSLQGDRTRPAVKTNNGGVIFRTIKTDDFLALKDICNQEGVTLFVSLLGIINILLIKYTGQSDIIIGTPIAGREHPGLAEQIGCYVNTLALRFNVEKYDNYKQLLIKVKQVVLNAYEHQMYPFDELVKDLNLKRDMSHNPLFDIMVVLQNTGDDEITKVSPTELKITKYESERQLLSKFDQTFTFNEVEGELNYKIEYNSDIYNVETIERLGNHLEQLIGRITKHPLKPIIDLDYLAYQEKQQLLIGFNKTAVDYPLNLTIIDLFRQQVKRTPNNIAIEFEGRQLTYSELDKCSNQLAHYLHSKGVKTQNLIPICVERSLEIVIGLLGILKTGAAFVPVDPEYPLDRIHHILEDIGAKIIIADSQSLKKLSQITGSYDIICPDNDQQNINQQNTTNLEVVCSSEYLAYIIYTSGSTGKPKGVMIRHKNTVAFINWCKDEFKKSKFDAVIALTSICFDLSVFEIFYTLSVGKKIKMARNITSLPAILNTSENLLLNTVPSVVGSLISMNVDFSSIKVLNMAGERIPPGYISNIDCENIEVRNLYGPSEDTTYSTSYRIKSDRKLYIGKPIANTEIYILNELKNLQPINVIGEIYIGGQGLSEGYLNRPQLTTENFINNPFKNETIIYKTGDLGRWLPDGNIEFIGRIDDQVKIRGYRIELGEIEQALQKHPEIISAHLTALEISQTEKELVAYFVSKKALTISDITAYLNIFLPAYMIPAQFVRLDNLPLTPNGKIDRKKLPSPKELAIRQQIDYVAPRNEMEEMLMLIWKELLNKEKIGVHESFFDLGGHSLKATQLLSQIHKKFNVLVKLTDVFTNPTISALAEIIRAKKWIEQTKDIDYKARNSVEI